MRMAIGAAALALSTGAWADENSELLGRWYAALEKPDAKAAMALVADDATFRLDEFGRDMTRQDMADELEKADTRVRVRYQVLSESPGIVTTLACYTMDGSDRLRRETYTIAGGKIASAVQGEFDDDCTSMAK